MAIIGVDVDLTLVDSDLHWKAYLDAVGVWKEPYRFEDAIILNYDLSKHYLLPVGFDPYDFWRSSSCYDTMKPKDGSIDCLSGLAVEGHKIVFVSATKGLHGKSKYNWLQRHFPFMAGAIFTKEKQFVNCDILVDDRNNFLQKMPDTTKLIKYETKYTQDAVLTKPHRLADGWYGAQTILWSLLGE